LEKGFELSNVDNIRLIFPFIGLFFLVSAVPTFLFLKERKPRKKLGRVKDVVQSGWDRIRFTLENVVYFKELVKFLVVFAFFNCGLSTVITFGSIYAARTIGFSGKELFLFFLVLQVFSSVGAFASGFLQDKIGSGSTLKILLVVWFVYCVGAYLTYSKTVFFLLGILAGLAIGATYSSSRALVGYLSPPDKSAEFFGFWGMFWRFSSAIGPSFFGLTSRLTGSQRTGILMVSLFFLAGMIGMFFVDEGRGRKAILDYIKLGQENVFSDEEEKETKR
jgi:UMF1 family MFS transporter